MTANELEELQSEIEWHSNARVITKDFLKTDWWRSASADMDNRVQVYTYLHSNAENVGDYSEDEKLYYAHTIYMGVEKYSQGKETGFAFALMAYDLAMKRFGREGVDEIIYLVRSGSCGTDYDDDTWAKFMVRSGDLLALQETDNDEATGDNEVNREG